MTPGSRNPSDGGCLALGPRDRRILAWITAPEAASARSVLDLAFADLRGVRQDRPRRWSPLVDALSRAVVVRLPRWIWIALALLLATAVTVATLLGVERLRLLFDRLTELPAVPAQMSSVACSAGLASAPNARCLTATLPVRHERPEGGSIAVSVIELGSSHARPGIRERILHRGHDAGPRARPDRPSRRRNPGRSQPIRSGIWTPSRCGEPARY
jgi:hypothetical protein